MMPRIEAAGGKGRIVEMGNVMDKDAAVASPARLRYGHENLFIKPDYWLDSPMVVMLSGTLWESSGGNQRPVAMTRELVRAGCHVLYSTGAQQKMQWAGNVLLMGPNELLDASAPLLQIPGTIICTLPVQSFVDVCEGFQDNGWTIIYDVLDDWGAFGDEGYIDWYDAGREKHLMEMADTLTASAGELQEHIKRLTGRESALVPNGGPSRPFAESERPNGLPQGREGTAVYCGYLQGPWFDWYLLMQTAKDMPEVEFTVVGAHGGCTLPNEPNLHFVGEKPYAEAMRYVQHADVGIIPFKADDVCAAVDPIKWYDYIAGCCHVVATWPLTDIHGRDFTSICPQGATSMAAEIRVALDEPEVTVGEAAELLETGNTSWANRTKALMLAAGVAI